MSRPPALNRRKSMVTRTITESHIAPFDQHGPLLFGIPWRMLGNPVMPRIFCKKVFFAGCAPIRRKFGHGARSSSPLLRGSADAETHARQIVTKQSEIHDAMRSIIVPHKGALKASGFDIWSAPEILSQKGGVK
jgi:hypothetical protein